MPVATTKVHLPADAWYHVALLPNGLRVLFRRGRRYLGDVYFDSVYGKWIALVTFTLFSAGLPDSDQIPADVPCPRALAIRMTAQQRKIVYCGDSETDAIAALWASRIQP